LAGRPYPHRRVEADGEVRLTQAAYDALGGLQGARRAQAQPAPFPLGHRAVRSAGRLGRAPRPQGLLGDPRLLPIARVEDKCAPGGLASDPLTLTGIALCVAGLWFLLQRTPFGRVVRAGVQNPDMVGALGISLQPYMSAVAALGIGLAGLAGVLLAPIYSIHPAMGQEIITPAFVVVVIGGLGSFWGVVAAALLVGLVKGLMVGIGYSAASTAAIYLLMLLVLLFRPRGLFGERIMRFE